MSFFQGASNVAIYGGSFVHNDVKGDLKVDDQRRYNNNLNSNNKATSNVVDSYNDNSRRISEQFDWFLLQRPINDVLKMAVEVMKRYLRCLLDPQVCRYL